MESFGDKLRAFALCAAALHRGVFVLALLIGLWWTPRDAPPVSMPGPVIEATLVGPTAAPKARSGAAKPTPPKPAPRRSPSRRNRSRRSRAKPMPQPEPPKPRQERRPKCSARMPIDREKVAALGAGKGRAGERRSRKNRQHQKQVLLEQEKERQKREQQQKQLDGRPQAARSGGEEAQAGEAATGAAGGSQPAHGKPAQPAAEHERRRRRPAPTAQDNDLTARYARRFRMRSRRTGYRPDSTPAGLRSRSTSCRFPAAT